MSGDVQPRKRKDKKRKKDELSVEEHRGTAATFGEGDVQMHSQHDHGTGGHWCAKIIFFSLLAVLVTLIGLIILENRGLTELEANAVESQYSGLLDGWIEDTPDDDHHDEHTLDLKHHEHDDVDEPESENDQEFEDDDEDEDNDDDDEQESDFNHDEGDDDEDDENDDDENENESKEIDNDEEETQDGETDQEQDNDNNSNEEEDEEIEEISVKATENRYAKPDDDEDVDNDDDDDDERDDDDRDDDADRDDDDDDDGDDNKNQADKAEDLDDNDSRKDTRDDNEDDNISNEVLNNDDDRDNTQSVENDDDDEDYILEEQVYEDDEEHEEDEEEADEEIEKIEKEVLDQDVSESTELPLDASVEKEEETSVEAVSPDEEYEVDDKAFLEVDDLDEPAVELIAPPPPGKPYAEIEDEVSPVSPADALAEEEEYEKQQEELRQQEAQSTQMWLKLAVGGALLAATHAVIRRATAPRDTPESEQDEHGSREETPLTDRRMTLIPEQTSNVVSPQSFRPNVEEEIIQKVSSVAKADVFQKQDSEEVDEDVALDEVEEDQVVQVKKTDDKNKELYSDDDEIEADEDVDDEEELEEKIEAPKSILKVPSVKKEPEPAEVPEDVEIIDDEQIEEEVEEVDEEVEDEEEISDVDDAELLSRLEAKYGRLPEPERPGQKHKDGGNSFEEDWPGEPGDPYWREQLEKAEQELRQGAYDACETRAGAAALAGSARARWLRARALDQLAEVRRDNNVLARAIAAYKKLLEMNERLSDKKLLEVALRTIDRIQFRGAYLNAEPIYRLLIRRFPNDVNYRNNLTISFLMANRADLATEVLKETLRLWPNDRVALAHYGFVLKTEQNKLEEAVTYFQRALEGDAGPANEPRFYYHLGDALLMLGRRDEAQEVHERGAALGHFLSPSQRSLYNVPHLKSQPWWDVETTPYAKLARELEGAWREILKEGEAAKALYEKEKEGLRERGEWSQLDLFVRGREVPGRCARAPVTCRIVKGEPAAQCRRGQVKFSLLSGGTHVRAHVGPTNCRLRMHLALSNTDRTYLRVDQEIRQWQVGKVLMFDDSFEHEVWHNGSGARLVLIVDVWHPALTARERLALPAI